MRILDCTWDENERVLWAWLIRYSETKRLYEAETNRVWPGNLDIESAVAKRLAVENGDLAGCIWLSLTDHRFLTGQSLRTPLCSISNDFLHNQRSA